MSALLGIEMNLVEEACKEASDVGVVVVANDNAPGQIVISGATKAVEKASEIAKKKGARRAIPLNVSTPNHSPLLKPAADKMREALARIIIRPTVVPLISNVTASEIGDPDRIRSLLVEQLTARVRWRESVAGFRALARLLAHGGRFVAWCYAREGNGWVLTLVDPLRRLTSRGHISRVPCLSYGFFRGRMNAVN